MSTNEGQAWAGWFRAKGSDRWDKLCTADTYQRCMALLLEAQRGSGDLVVLLAGEHPASRSRRAIPPRAPAP